jgi:putative flippase GtrA
MTTLVLPRTPLPTPPHVDRALVRQVLRYVVVGGLGTVTTALVYLVLRVWWAALPANLAALVLSTVATTEINRRFTFGGARTGRGREYLQDLGTVVFYAGYGSAVLLVLGAVVDDPSALQESATVAAAACWAARCASWSCGTGCSAAATRRDGACTAWRCPAQ